jgi:hypothetical protein
MANIEARSKACLNELESNMNVLKQNEQITQVCSTYLYFVQVWLVCQLLHNSMLIKHVQLGQKNQQLKHIRKEMNMTPRQSQWKV